MFTMLIAQALLKSVFSLRLTTTTTTVLAYPFILFRSKDDQTVGAKNLARNPIGRANLISRTFFNSG